jgi:hypothetical protein
VLDFEQNGRPTRPSGVTSSRLPPLTFGPGAHIGPYDIGSALGAGGMGEVFRATDQNLRRQVAIKVLPPALALDPDRLGRFQREAETLAALNHPNIAQIHGLERYEGTIALVMELVEGPTLAERIAQGPLPLREALIIAGQIADALEAAHEAGIIHRDLKPANIKIRPEGTVKVLDFGLAKAVDPAAGAMLKDLSRSPTLTNPVMTAAGIIVGTAAYMSPEQATGKPVDRRTDLWAFGVVVAEMLTGRRVFKGETAPDLVAAILRDEPDWQALPPDTPAPIRRMLRRCLAKDRRRRLADAADARLEVEESLTASAAVFGPAPTRARMNPLLLTLALLLGAAIAGFFTWALTRRAPGPVVSLTRLSVTVPPALPMTSLGNDRDVALAPDGSFMVYRAGGQGQLVVRRLDRIDGTAIAGVLGARDPIVSPDGRWIGFIEDNVTLKKVAVAGGAPITLARIPGAAPRGAAWLDDSTIVVATNDPTTGLLQVSAGGGQPVVLTTPDVAGGILGHWYPSALPGGTAVLFTIVSPQRANAQVAVLDLRTHRQTVLIGGGSDATYVSSGHLVYATGGGLSAVRFDLARLAVLGDPVPIVENISVSSSGAVNASLSRNGTLAYVPGGLGGLAPKSLVWVDRQGHETAIAGPRRAYQSLRLSPDGTRVALEIGDQDLDIWVGDLARLTPTRLTSDPSSDLAPVWTHDGRAIVFSSTRSGAPNLFMRNANGTGTDVRLTSSSSIQFPSSVSSDGGYVFAYERRAETGADVVRFSLNHLTSARTAADLRAEGLVETRFEERNGEISPDGHFLAYQSNESGQLEIYVRPYPNLADDRVKVSSDGGTRPVWTQGGKELVYLNSSNRLTAVSLEISGTTVRPGTPAVLMSTAYAAPAAWRSYDATPDGQRFLVIKDGVGGADAETPPGLVVVQNWPAELSRLLPRK